MPGFLHIRETMNGRTSLTCSDMCILVLLFVEYGLHIPEDSVMQIVSNTSCKKVM